LLFLLFHLHRAPRALHSFPTRRSSDLSAPRTASSPRLQHDLHGFPLLPQRREERLGAAGQWYGFHPPVRLDLPLGKPLDGGPDVDRKSTRLNSSHRTISYAVFCLKKKK